MSDISYVPLSWIKSEVDFALGHARERIAEVKQTPRDLAPLVEASRHVHETTGAIRVIGLEGLAVFSGELEILIETAVRDGGALSTRTIALIERSLLALAQFLDDLQRGRPYVPLSLLALFRELRAMRGGTPARAVELFFPDLRVDLPAFALPPVATAHALAPFIRDQCVTFQRGLVEVLRDATNIRAFVFMRSALTALAGVSAESATRAVCWVASGYVDGLARRAILFDSTARGILAQIEQQLRRLGAGGGVAAGALTRELLYEIAVSAPQDGVIGEIKRRYRLHDYLPEAGFIQYDDAKLRPLLGQAGQAIAASKEAWARTAAGDPRAFASFRSELARAVQALAALGVPMLGRLAEVINGMSTTITTVSREQRSAIALDMATALLLIEKTVAAYPEVSTELAVQLEAMAARLSGMQGGNRAADDSAGAAQLAAAIRKAEERLVLTQVEREIRTSLGEIEQVLDGYFRDPQRRDSLPPLVAVLDQVRGALEILGLAAASRLLHACRAQIEQLAVQVDRPPAQTLEALAEGLSALGGVADAIRDEQAFPEALVAQALARLETQASAATVEGGTPAPQTAPVPAPVTRRAETLITDSTVDRARIERELIEVYLAEAQDVLGQVRANLQAARSSPEDVAALTAIRRGFHTLKGSGRTVGLADLGNAAWEVEQLLNDWLQDGAPVTPALGRFVEAACRSFERWVGELAAGLEPDVDPDGLAAAAEALREARAQEPAAVVSEPEFVAPVSGSGGVNVGSVTLSGSLYAIYVCEAADLFRQLRECVGTYRREPQTITAFARAAHTLGSSSATAGFTAVQKVAHALEDVLRELERRPVLAATATSSLIEEAVARLGGMVETVTARQAPEDDEDLVVRLLAECERLHLRAAEVSPPEEEEAKGDDAGDGADLVDPQLLPIFLEEAADLLPEMAQNLRAWQNAPDDAEAPASLSRALHTLKGSARAAGLVRFGEVVHRAEGRLAAGVARGDTSPAFIDRLQRDFDTLADVIDGLRRRRGEPAASGLRSTDAVPPDGDPVLRVRAAAVDRLVNQAGEIAIARSRIEAEIGSVKRALLDLAEGVERLRGQLRETEIQAESQLQARLSLVKDHGDAFDPLEFDRYTRLQELTRLMLESLYDITSVQQGLLTNVDEADTALRQQLRLNRELHEDLMRARTMPFSSQAERLYRVVRQTTLDSGRRAHLTVRGGHVEIDRSVMEKIGAPIEHLLRNAVVHGLEASPVRTAAGKAPEGALAVEVRHEGGEVVITITDDGAGLNLPAIAAKARAMGLLAADEMPDAVRAAELIFMPGFTTAGTLTESAGRGVGLDAAKSEVAAIGGRIEVASRQGSGTSFTLYLPISLAVIQGVLVTAAGHTMVLPASLIQHVKDVRPGDAAALHESGRTEWQDENYPVHYLPRLFNDQAAVPAGAGYTSLVLLQSRMGRAAVHVDRVLGEAEFVVKAVGPQIAGLPWVNGGTVLSDGRVVLIVNPLPLVPHAVAAASVLPVIEEQIVLPDVMVVDDSLTVRTITGRLLAREGYRFVSAKDGVDALDQLATLTPRLMIVDLEMPRMDGFDLIRNVRATPRLARVPIVVLTSRTADKHRSLALSLGADVFLGKPYQEDALLRHARDLMAAREAEHEASGDGHRTVTRGTAR